jgi:uncharacterized protein involved in type VI secretion and phage assembly
MPKFVTQLTIKIGGQDKTSDILDDVTEIVVDSSLYLPDMFTIRLGDPDFTWVDSADLAIGKEVEILTKIPDDWYGGEIQATLIKGEITSLEPDFSDQGDSTMLVRGYDKSHRLHRGRVTRTFLQQKDSDIVGTIASEAGLTVEADATTTVYDYILQNNQTDMEFLLARAERIGYQVFVADGKLYFKKGDSSLGEGPELKFGDTLHRFEPRWTSVGQADQMIIKGWDPKTQQAITSSQKAPNGSLNQGGMSQTGGALANSAFGSAQEIIVDRPTPTTGEATEMATGLSNDISLDFVQAEGECDGHPKLKAGWKVNITGLGTRFSGKYFISSATHIWTPGGEYLTRFSISGRQPNTLSHLLDSGNNRDQSLGLVHGVVPAKVTNLNDPDSLGRVKVKFPWLPQAQGAEIESTWARIAAPTAGPERGFLYLPEIDDEVLVAFERGDTRSPYIVGALWNGQHAPPEIANAVSGDGKVNQRILKSRSGHLVILNDTENSEQISVTSKSGHTVILDDKSGSEMITIKDKTGKNKMVIDSTKNSMSLNVDGDFSVTAGGKVNIKSTGNMTLESSSMSEFKTSGNMTVKSTGNLSLQATGQGELKGTAGITVQSPAATMVKGATVMIN